MIFRLCVEVLIFQKNFCPALVNGQCWTKILLKKYDSDQEEIVGQKEGAQHRRSTKTKEKKRKTFTHQLDGKAICEGKEALHTTEQVTKKVS